MAKVTPKGWLTVSAALITVVVLVVALASVASYLIAFNSSLVLASHASPGTIFVDDCPRPGSGTSGDPFCTIQAAVDHAIPGDTIEVSPGTYIENVDVGTDNVTIRSTSGPSVTTVEQNDPGDYVFDVDADGVTIEGFGIVYGGQIQHVHGIRVGRSSAGTIIKGNDVSSTFVNVPPPPIQSAIFGICVCGGIDPGSPAVLEFGPSNTRVEDNTLSHNPIAISVFGASNTLVKGNSISDSGRNGIVVTGGASGTIVEHNTVSGSSFLGITVLSFLGIAAIDTIVQDNVVSGSGGAGIGVFRGASNTTVRDNEVSSSGFSGIAVATGATISTVQTNKVNGNRCGVFVGFGVSNNQFIANDLRLNVLGAVSADTATVAFFQNSQPQTDGLSNTFNGNLPDPLTSCTPAQDVENSVDNLIDDLQFIVASNPGTPLADKLEDAIAKLDDAAAELDKTPPDNQAALGSIEGAVGDIEAAVSSGLLDPEQGGQLMDQLAEVARSMAQNALNEAIAESGDPVVINDAQQALAEGDALRAAGAYKDAVNKYKDALAKAESTP